ncbi:hypothetical protein ACFC0C_14165 [Streptomyces sp. NPDC056178]|uniref:hypothetical protein n=1 Tax=unclassified Streptomyces TaxID=2593676 RepID=UPI0035DDF0B9
MPDTCESHAMKDRAISTAGARPDDLPVIPSADPADPTAYDVTVVGAGRQRLLLPAVPGRSFRLAVRLDRTDPHGATVRIALS